MLMTEPRRTIEGYMAAMRRGPEAEEEMVALFAEDAVYDEPFSGHAPAVGVGAIRDRLRLGWQTPLPDLELDISTVEIVGDTAVVTWECRSSAFDAPARGRDRYEFRGGKIAALRVQIDP
jgi:hypothetical protein